MNVGNGDGVDPLYGNCDWLLTCAVGVGNGIDGTL